MIKKGYVYIIANANNTVLYTGITSGLKKRIWQHKEKVVDGFSKKYNISKLVYFEAYDDIKQAILREKQIKGGSKLKKISLIESLNKEWKDLYCEL
jgi:putative endonuclease